MKIRSTAYSAIALLLGLAGSAPAMAISLQDAIKNTLSTNPEVQRAAKQRLARDQEVRQARGGYYPDLDLTAGVGYEWTDSPTTRAAGNGNERHMSREEMALNLRQMLYDGEATKNEVERHQARVNSAAYTVQGVSQNTALRAAEVYIELLKQHRFLELAEENVAAHVRIYDQIKLRSDSGVGRKADLDQIEGRLALARSNVVSSQNNIHEAEANYIRVIGELPDKLERPQGLEQALPKTVEEAVASGFEQHPTLQSAIADVEATLAQNRASHHTFRPRFDLEVGRTWNNDIDGVDGRNEDFTAMLRMRWNLLNGGSDKARTEETAHLINEAKEVQNNTRRQVEESVRLSWTSYESSKIQRDYLQKHMEASRKTREAYTKQFNLGQRTLLDLLDTENEVFESSRAYAEADHTNLYAQYRILVGMGKLLETLDVPLPQEASPLMAAN